jgi:hypothetical protein
MILASGMLIKYLQAYLQFYYRSSWLSPIWSHGPLSLLEIGIRESSRSCTRLATNYHHRSPYGVQESLEGFKRAAATHGWKVGPRIGYSILDDLIFHSGPGWHRQAGSVVICDS